MAINRFDSWRVSMAMKELYKVQMYLHLPCHKTTKDFTELTLMSLVAAFPV
jgi:hypothetical protein